MANNLRTQLKRHSEEKPNKWLTTCCRKDWGSWEVVLLGLAKSSASSVFSTVHCQIVGKIHNQTGCTCLNCSNVTCCRVVAWEVVGSRHEQCECMFSLGSSVDPPTPSTPCTCSAVSGWHSYVQPRQFSPPTRTVYSSNTSCVRQQFSFRSTRKGIAHIVTCWSTSLFCWIRRFNGTNLICFMVHHYFWGMCFVGLPKSAKK